VPMYRRGWYQVMGGEVGFCGPVCAGFLSFASFVRLCTKAVASRVGRPCFLRRCATDCSVLSHMVSRDQASSFFDRAGLWSDRTFPFLAVRQGSRFVAAATPRRVPK
jgi:hypothetical protein